MPELPEVEAMRRLLERHAAGRTVCGVVAREAGGGPRDGKFDDKVVAEGVTEKGLVVALLGRSVLAARRRGKQLWLELSGDGPHLLLHCGMTGTIVVEGVPPMSYQSFKVDEAWPPRFAKLQLELRDASGGLSKVAFADPRRFGKLLLRSRPLDQPPISELAADPLEAPPPLDTFAEALLRSAMPVKALLLDQSKVVCGVGNWVADEALHEARVHPAAVAESLSRQQAADIHEALLFVVRAAAEVDADASRFPEHWLFHSRWGVGANGGEIELLGGRRLAFSEVGGRTTAFEPAVQRFGEGRGTAAPLTAPRARAPRKRPAAAAAPTAAFAVPLRKRPAAALDLGR